MPAPFDPERLLAVLGAYDVDFVLIGGLAAALHGSPTTTNDADICPRRDRTNLERLAASARALGARIRTDAVSEDVAFDCSANFSPPWTW